MNTDSITWIEPVARQVLTRTMTVVMFRDRDSDMFAVAQVFRKLGKVRAPNYTRPGWSTANLDETISILDFVGLDKAKLRYLDLCVHPYLSLE